MSMLIIWLSRLGEDECEYVEEARDVEPDGECASSGTSSSKLPSAASRGPHPPWVCEWGRRSIAVCRVSPSPGEEALLRAGGGVAVARGDDGDDREEMDEMEPPRVVRLRRAEAAERRRPREPAARSDEPRIRWLYLSTMNDVRQRAGRAAMSASMRKRTCSLRRGRCGLAGRCERYWPRSAPGARQP